LRELIFSHGTTAKVKNIISKESRCDIYARWVGFSEDDANFIAEGADIRLERHSYVSQHLEPPSPRLRRAKGQRVPPATDEAKEWGEVSVAG